jgi:nucleobase:cation symporter-1, NCS1 family
MATVGVGEADTNVWPLLLTERTWGPWRLGAALATAAAATWCYLIGEEVGYYLPFVKGSIALTAGSMIGMLLVLLAAGPACIRFGIDSIASTRPQFGTRGWVLPAIMQFVSIIGWNSVLLIFFAKSATRLLVVLGWIPHSVSVTAITPFTTVIACTLVFVVLLWGANGLTRIANVLVLHVAVGFWMLYLIMSRQWPELLAARPPLAHSGMLWNYTTGVEIGISSLLAWWPYLGAMVRMAPHGRTIAVPVMLGMGAPVPILSMVGLAGLLVLKTSDPSHWMQTIGGTTYAIVALTFVGTANIGTAITGIYASAVGLRNFHRLQRSPWSLLLLLTVLPVALIGATIPDLFFNHFGSFLALIGVGFAPLCGIQIADYYGVRRRQLDITGLFRSDGEGPYKYWRGFNPGALVSMAVGVIVYGYLLNPLTYESHWPYQFTTASLPAATVAGLVYISIARAYSRARRRATLPGGTI